MSYLDIHREAILTAASDKGYAERNASIVRVAACVKLLVASASVFDSKAAGNPLWLPDRILLDAHGQPTDDVLYGNIKPVETCGTDRNRLESLPRTDWWERISGVSFFLMNSTEFDDEVEVLDLERINSPPLFSATSQVGLPMGTVDLEAILVDLQRYDQGQAAEFSEQ